MPVAISLGRLKGVSRRQRASTRRAFQVMPWPTAGVDVAVGVVPQQAPDAAVRPEGHRACLPGGVEEEGDHGVARDVAGDVLLGVVGAHLFLVDVFLEDIAEDVRVDLVVFPVRPLVQVPAVAVEEVEDPLERFVGDADVGVVAFQVVNIEQAAVEEGDVAE